MSLLSHNGAPCPPHLIRNSQSDGRVNKNYRYTLLDSVHRKMWTMVAPKPLAVETRPHKFTVVKEFLDLEVLVENNRKPGLSDVRGDVDYLQPCLQVGSSQSKHEAFQNLVQKNGGPRHCRLLYITRHGQAEHNEISSRRGKKEAFAVLGHYSDQRDPSLTDQGISQAIRVGTKIKNSKAAQFALPTETHSSSLWRCVQTAQLSSRVYTAGDKPMQIKVSDNWREWMGCGIMHISDGRSTKTELHRRNHNFTSTIPHKLSSLDNGIDRSLTGPNLSWSGDGSDIDTRHLSEGDVGFHTPETFINVDIRLETALTRLFDSSPEKEAFHIATHGRATQSLLRLLGFERNPTWDPIEKYRVWDFDNCGTIAVLVRCEKRSLDEMDIRLNCDQALQREEYEFINRKYQDDIEAGFLAIQEHPQQWVDELEKLRKESEQSPHVAWRHELLKKALRGSFRRGDFQVKSWNWTSEEP